MQIDLYVRFVGALLLVIGLVLLTASLLKRFSRGGPGVKHTDRRLTISEILPLDPRRRLVLIRHDTHEHLLLLGGSQDILIASSPPGHTRQPEDTLPTVESPAWKPSPVLMPTRKPS